MKVWPSNVAQGRWAERRAALEMERRGYHILESNFRCRRGEIDLIAQHGDTRCFVEVKARSRADFGGALPSVDARKRSRVAAAAEVYLSRVGYQGACRFDVVTLEREGDAWQIEIFEDAYLAG